MNRALTSLVPFAAVTLTSTLAYAQAVAPMPPPPPPPPDQAQTAPAVVPAQPPPQQQQQQQPAYVAAEERQIRKAENAVFLELGGNGLIYSINYERIFGDSDFSLRVGFSYISLGATANDGTGSSAKLSLMTFPVLGNYYVGGRDHKLQLGGGLTFLYVSGSSSNSSNSLVTVSGFVPAPTVAIGYRYLPAKGGFTFFIGFTPFIIPGGDKVLQPWAGMSFGGAF